MAMMLPEEVWESVIIPLLSVDDMRVLSLASHSSGALLQSLATTVTITEGDDAIFQNAVFVSRLSALSKLHVRHSRQASGAYLTTIVDVAQLRTLGPADCLRILPTCTTAVAMLVGALVATLDISLVTRCGRRVPLRACRECATIRLRGSSDERGLVDADLAALLGALRLNARLEELDLCGSSAMLEEQEKWGHQHKHGGEEEEEEEEEEEMEAEHAGSASKCRRRGARRKRGSLSRALVAAIGRTGVRLRHHQHLELPGTTVRAAVELPEAHRGGALARPSWLDAFESGEEGEYVHIAGSLEAAVDATAGGRATSAPAWDRLLLIA